MGEFKLARHRQRLIGSRKRISAQGDGWGRRRRQKPWNLYGVIVKCEFMVRSTGTVASIGNAWDELFTPEHVKRMPRSLDCSLCFGTE